MQYQPDDQASTTGAPPLSSDPGRPDASSTVTRRTTLAERLAWTPRQRRGMAVVLAFVLGVLTWRAIRNPSHITDPQPVRPSRFDELADRLNPNTATWQELAAIPSLGEKRAKAIVEHRLDWMSRHPGQLPYGELLDLAAVSGIGGTMLEQIRPHLIFPAPTTTQAAR
ncbi:ComEA family DNA-binding protein [Humisphaera borealis]|uniref:Helix-hairpin-helix domain-containing protein n=1 Tax=Humisphaera borealis TaxID=2807512 RepID=A0A7M2WSQ9_9BACT|nr:helix-hairpin-helix domain-containing protein [Humisphaera borealis]QOV88314.1 helix-hairpin-helix domain-containing protein [Humisphaera borealis]